jgi:hypothetical protein
MIIAVRKAEQNIDILGDDDCRDPSLHDVYYHHMPDLLADQRSQIQQQS